MDSEQRVTVGTPSVVRWIGLECARRSGDTGVSPAMSSDSRAGWKPAGKMPCFSETNEPPLFFGRGDDDAFILDIDFGDMLQRERDVQFFIAGTDDEYLMSRRLEGFRDRPDLLA